MHIYFVSVYYIYYANIIWLFIYIYPVGIDPEKLPVYTCPPPPPSSHLPSSVGCQPGPWSCRYRIERKPSRGCPRRAVHGGPTQTCQSSTEPRSCATIARKPNPVIVQSYLCMKCVFVSWNLTRLIKSRFSWILALSVQGFVSWIGNIANPWRGTNNPTEGFPDTGVSWHDNVLTKPFIATYSLHLKQKPNLQVCKFI